MISLKLRHSLSLGGSLLTMSALALSPAAHAQDGSAAAALQLQSILSGSIYDEAGSALPGARVVIAELGVETTTDLQGSFILNTPDSGEVTVEVRYIGRPVFTQKVTLTGKTTAVDLTIPRSEGDEIVVTAASILDNTARALNQQRQAANTTNVISSDAIGRFPDPNIAEALQRVAGIGIERDQGEGRYINIRGAPADFTAVSVDGVTITAPSPTTRAIDLDTIPSDIVANLEISKTLLPSQDADSIAGAVNISTRSAFDSRGFRLSGSAGLSYNQFGKTNDKRASLTVSNRFGADRQFGVLLSGSYSKTERQPDNVENVWARNAAGQYRIVETLFKDYDTSRERIAATGALEWRSNDGSRLYVRGSYSRFEDDEYRNRLSIDWNDGATLQPGSTDARATFSGTRLYKQVRHRAQLNEIYTVVVGGEQQIGEGKFDFSTSYTRSEQTYPRRDELLYRSSLRPTLTYDVTNPDSPEYSLFTSGEHLQLDRYSFRENAFRANDTRNNEWSTQAKFEVPAHVGAIPMTFSVGARYTDRDVFADEERLRSRVAGQAPTGTLASLLTDIKSSNFDYALGNKFDTAKSDAYFDAARPFSDRRIPQSITADYEATERNIGVFTMLNFDLGDTMLIAGARYEYTRFNGSAPSDEVTNATGIANARTSYGHLFPNLTVRHAFTPDLIGRFALTRGINRPNFVDIVPRVVDNTDGSITRLTSGNPNLNPTLSNNIDAGLEYYLRPLGLISVNAFYKDLSDYRYTVTRNGTYLGLPAEFTRPENAPDGKLYGFEVNWQQQFTFLPGLLSGFGVFANYTWTDAEIKLSQPYGGRTLMPLPGQSRSSWNAALFYERGPFNARVSYTKRSDYLGEINAEDPNLDIYWEGRGQLDVTGSYQLFENIGLFVEAKNLTNSPGVRYYGTRSRVYEYEKFGYTLFGGVRVKF